MGLFSSRNRKPRRFNYEPRHYNPEKDEKIKKRMRIQSRTRRRGTPGLIYLGLLLFFVIFIYSTLG